jgi:hypothetical protein
MTSKSQRSSSNQIKHASHRDIAFLQGVKKQLTANMPHYHNRNGGKTTTAVRKGDMAPLKTNSVNQSTHNRAIVTIVIYLPNNIFLVILHYLLQVFYPIP